MCLQSLPQRSLITRFPIPQANTAAIKIKGLFFSPMVLPPSHGMPKISPVLMKPYNGFGAVGCGNHFTAEGWVDPYDCSDKQVVGGRTTSKAMQELQINSTLRMAGFPVPYDLGIGVFSSDYYQPTETIHERPAYIAYAIKDPWDFRLFDMLYLLKNEPDYKDRVIHMMKTWGELLRNLHDSHFYWSEPYMENVGFAGDDIQMYDLENTNHLPTLTPVQAAMYRFNDLCIALPMIVDLDKEIHELEAPELRSYANKGYVDHIGLRLFAMMGITAVLRKNNLNNLSKPFLKGYFRKPLKINHLRKSKKCLKNNYFLSVVSQI